MKLIYAADNRNRENLGCRATSIALSQLISKKHDIVATITGEYTNYDNSLFYIPGLPSWGYTILGKLSYWGALKRTWNLILNKITKEKRFIFDYVDEEPQKSVKNFLKCLPANKHLQEMNLLKYDFEGIVINGEGTMIMTDKPRKDTLVYLMLVWWAKSINKKVFFVNAMFSDCPVSGSNKKTISTSNSVLSDCDLLILRDPVSLKYVEENLKKCIAKYIPDALFTWSSLINDNHKLEHGKYYLPFGEETDGNFNELDFTEPYVCVSGSSMSAWNQKSAVLSYVYLVNQLKKEIDMPIYLIQSCIGDNFLKEVSKYTQVPLIPVKFPIVATAKILANARLFISGRFHPSIMASMGGTPCIFLKSNSHKTWSLQNMLNYKEVIEFSANPSESECSEIIKLAKEKLSFGEDERRRMISITAELSEQAQELLELIK
jgi:polysaccharide pyruvyl transferase WcaK-like protein